MTTAAYANEVSWTIQGESGTAVCEGNGYSLNDHTSVHACCLPPGSYTLECYDSFGDGWHGGFITIAETQAQP